jgi:hypothetical protein
MTAQDLYGRYRSFWIASTGQPTPEWTEITERARAAWEYLASSAIECATEDPVHEIIGNLRREVSALRVNCTVAQQRTNALAADLDLARKSYAKESERARKASTELFALKQSMVLLQSMPKEYEEASRKEAAKSSMLASRLEKAQREIVELRNQVEKLTAPRPIRKTSLPGRRIESIFPLTIDDIFRRRSDPDELLFLSWDTESQRESIAAAMDMIPEKEPLPSYWAFGSMRCR